MAEVICPTCERRFDSEESTAMPFCSSRCRQIDLGRWVDERFGLPHERRDDEEEEYLE